MCKRIIFSFILLASINVWSQTAVPEKGVRAGGCRIELFVDLNFKTNQILNSTTGVMEDTEVWPMLDCTKTPPDCDTGYTAIRISNFMQNSTGVGIVAGDKTTIIQNWSCLKI